MAFNSIEGKGARIDMTMARSDGMVREEGIIGFFTGVYLSITPFGDHVFYMVNGLNQKQKKIFRVMGRDLNPAAHIETIPEPSIYIGEQ